MLHAITQNLKDGTADLSVTGTAIASYKTLIGAGAENGATVSVVESSNGLMNKTVLTLDETSVTAANTTGASFGSVKLYDFPAGCILVLGASANLTFDWSTDLGIALDGSGDFSIGSTATAEATLATTEVNLVPSSAMEDNATADGVKRGVGSSTAATYLDGTTTAADVYLNIIIDDADVANADSSPILVSGTLTLFWINLGDYTAV